jgi:hypothetical protein
MKKKRRAIDPSELSWTELAQHDPKLLREELETRLATPTNVNQLSREITRLLKGLGRRPGTPETVARHIATGLASRFNYVSPTLEQLIANRPTELAAALEASDWDEYSKVAERISSLPKPNKTRPKQLTEEERRRSRRARKNRYERRKRQRFRYGEMGLIEEQFAIRKRPFSLSDPSNRPPLTSPCLNVLLNRHPRTGPCLDVLLNFGYVPMSGEMYCLESLLGMDRHNFPKSLPYVRRGRRIFYDIRALITCIVALLEQGKWLPETDRRTRGLSGIIQRARDIGQPEVAAILEQIFRPYLT